MTKVIHVHLIFEKKDYYFGSISAIYTVLNEAEIGIKQSSLQHAGPPDHFALLSYLIDLSVSQSSALVPIYSAHGYHSC